MSARTVSSGGQLFLRGDLVLEGRREGRGRKGIEGGKEEIEGLLSRKLKFCLNGLSQSDWGTREARKWVVDGIGGVEMD